MLNMQRNLPVPFLPPQYISENLKRRVWAHGLQRIYCWPGPLTRRYHPMVCFLSVSLVIEALPAPRHEACRFPARRAWRIEFHPLAVTFPAALLAGLNEGQRKGGLPAAPFSFPLSLARAFRMLGFA